MLPGIYALASGKVAHYICGQMYLSGSNVVVRPEMCADKHVKHLVDTHKLFFVGGLELVNAAPEPAARPVMAPTKEQLKAAVDADHKERAKASKGSDF